MVWRLWRPFFGAFLLTLCLFGFVFSCVVIEYNTQRVRVGTVDFGVQYTLEDGQLRITTEGQRTSSADTRLAEAVLPPSVQLLLALWRGQGRVWMPLLEI